MNKRLIDKRQKESVMKIRWIGLILILLFSVNVMGQGLFEDAAGKKDEDRTFELNGYLRSTFYLGKIPDRDLAETKSGYGEFSLKLRASKGSFGTAFAEVRFRRGAEFGQALSELTVREAFVSTYVGPFDFRFGHQIVVWGRADGINPTDNITPKNMLARSPDEDDRREANFLLRAFFNARPVRIEFIWVPVYRSSVVPTDLFPFPPGIMLKDPDYPNARLWNSAVAAKLNLELAAFDGSLSFFNGHSLFPGISFAPPDPEDPIGTVSIMLKSYRVNVFGADFSTTVAGRFGLRGEIAYRDPVEDYIFSPLIPNPELQYVLGIDREFSGNFSLIFQYIGKHIFDFLPIGEAWGMPMPQEVSELELNNRIISSQLYENTKSLSCRLGWNLLHETLQLELLGLANLTTEESLFRLKMAYDITDALTFTLGGELYSGPEDTLFDFVEEHLSSLFVELKISF